MAVRGCARPVRGGGGGWPIMGPEGLGGRNGDAGVSTRGDRGGQGRAGDLFRADHGCDQGSEVTVTEQDWLDLNREYREVFGESIPRMMLPADEEMAAALVREAIATRDASAIDRGIPGDALT